MPPEEEPQAPPPPDTEPTEAAPGEAEDEPQTLERAQELFDRGSKAIEDEDFVDAVDCLSRALEIRLGFPFPFPFPPSTSATLAVKRLRVSAEFGPIGGWYGAFSVRICWVSHQCLCGSVIRSNRVLRGYVAKCLAGVFSFRLCRG